MIKAMGRSRFVTHVASVVSGVLVATALVALPAAAAPDVRPDQTPQKSRRVDLGESRVPVYPKPIVPSAKPKAPRWPTGSAVVDLPPGQPAAGPAAADVPTSTKVRAGTLPVWVSRAAGDASKVRVEMLDQPTARSAGRDLAVRVTRADGSIDAADVTVAVDVSSFASAYGAGWASRLRLVRVPECGLTTTARPVCQATPLATSNDGKTLTATLRLLNVPPTRTVAPRGPLATTEGEAPVSGRTSGIVALAASTEASDGSGDFAATSLSPSATWSAGSNSGGFSWSYGMRVPPSLGGPAPSVSLAYSSQGVDGRMAATNNQPSWIGDGFDWSPGFIERRYVSCADDMEGANNNTTETGDLCWKTDNATISLNGSGGELLYNSTNGEWHARSEDGSKIERKTGAVNGDDNGEYWIVTTTDGTKYYFGLNRLQGWTSSKAETKSVQSVPVFGNHPNEPCHQTAFTDSDCAGKNQAYRWNLDYVVDPHGNTMSLWWGQDTNKYGRNNSETDLRDYTRDAWLDHIDYGTHQRDLINTVKTDTVYTSKPVPMRVNFTTGDRCLSSCWSGSNPVQANWLDTPWDLRCTASPCDDHSPAFWSSRRLATVETQVYRTASSALEPVERWTLAQSYPDPGDGTRPGMWLQKISHSGLVGGIAVVPDIEFTPVMLDNRVDTALKNGLRPMRWARMDLIKTESGGLINVDYLSTECVSGATPTPHTNAKRCYPVRWAPPDLGGTPGQEITDWFHKYVVSQVIETDATGPVAGSPLSTTTRYEYVGGAAWRYADDDGLTKDKFRTWNQWRGYDTVRTLVGDAAEQTRSETRFFRGMHGDKLSPTGGSRTITLTDTKGLIAGAYPTETIYDYDEFAGRTLESRAFTSPTGAAYTGSASKPWRSDPPTASRTIDGQTVNARYVNTSDSWTWATLDQSRPDRLTHTLTKFDSLGMAVEATNYGDTSKLGDEQCTLTDYARNDGLHIMSYPSRTRTYTLTCDNALQAGRQFTKDEISGEARTYYDGQAWGTAPTVGEATQVDTLKDWVGNAFVPLTMMKSAYDDYGRVTDKWDVDDNHSTVVFTPSTDGPVTGTTTTNVKIWSSNLTLDPAWGLVTASVDVNNRRTDVTYDPLGRVKQVWKPGRSKTTFPISPTISYIYTMSNTVASVVETKALGPNGNYISSYSFYDALLRPRQTQAPTADGSAGAVVTDTFYDSAGRSWRTYGPYIPDAADTPAPSAALSSPPSDGFDQIDEWWKTEFDGAGRPVARIRFSGIPEQWRTTTAYPSADRVEVIPPDGGYATSTITDAQGRTTQLRQHHSQTPTSGYDLTEYEYNSKGQVATVKNPALTEWRYEYDILGRQVKSIDPDKGATETKFDDAGRVTETKDAESRVLLYTYEQLGRKTGLYQSTITAANRLAKWDYDGLTNAKGMLTSSTRYVGGEMGAAYVSAITGLSTFGTPSQKKITIPASETGLVGTYQHDYTYKPNGATNQASQPFIGKTTGLYLGFENLTTVYNDRGQAEKLNTSIGATSYVIGTGFTDLGDLGSITLRNANGPQVVISQKFEQSTRRLSQILVTRDTAPTTVTDTVFAYNDAGTITSIKENSTLAGAETQCFTHDYLQRLREAWTPSSGNCADTRSATALGGPAPYWLSWTIDIGGNRTQQVRHTPGGDQTTDYHYDGPQPHTLTSTTGVSAGSYTYDQTGNTKCRPTAGTTNNCLTETGSQILTWDAEGHLANSQDTTGTTTYIYDADGNRLIRKDPAGKTLYLPGQELRVNPAGTTVLSCTRYYGWAGKTIAMRATGATGLVWIAGDRQGSVNVTIGTTGTQVAAIRRQDPYGNARGAVTGTWPSLLDKGYVGGTNDNTGLTHLGAREYDPNLGRFISIDPIVDFLDPQQLHGYSYASNSPIVASDPSGLRDCADDDCGTSQSPSSGCTSFKSCEKQVEDRNRSTWKRPKVTATTKMDKMQAKWALWEALGGPSCFGGTSGGTSFCDDVRAWAPEVIEHADAAGIDPRLLMSVLLIEVNMSDDMVPVDNLVQFGSWAADEIGAYGWLKDNLTDKGPTPPSLGWGNIKEHPFNQTVKKHQAELGGIEWTDLMSNHDLSIKVTAYRLRDLQDYAERNSTEQLRRNFTRDQVTAALYNVGEEGFDDAMREHGTLGPNGATYASTATGHASTANSLICGSGVWSCS